MAEWLTEMAEWCALVIEAVGIGLLTGLSLFALLLAVVHKLQGHDAETVYRRTRQRLGRSILLGLELLVAADIIHTVAVDLSYESVGVLGIIVLIRTFLSFTLDVELEGHWPWQASRLGEAGASEPMDSTRPELRTPD